VADQDDSACALHTSMYSLPAAPFLVVE
jgi:hypothetical protein